MHLLKSSRESNLIAFGTTKITWNHYYFPPSSLAAPSFLQVSYTKESSTKSRTGSMVYQNRKIKKISRVYTSTILINNICRFENLSSNFKSNGYFFEVTTNYFLSQVTEQSN